MRRVFVWLVAAAVLLIALAFFQLHAFSRPPPVPSKRLPKRPTLHVLFKPDDISASSLYLSQLQQQQQKQKQQPQRK